MTAAREPAAETRAGERVGTAAEVASADRVVPPADAATTPCDLSPAQRPVDDNHALRIGWVAGALMRSVEVEPLTGIKTRGVEILDDEDGNHLDTIRLYAPSGTFLVRVTRETCA